ncbi:anaerobic ribonucleoside-triphosphate reductase activating protein [Desulfoplanes formicivorans]|uniref:Radical SAM protein n=1 Tax=Desulfoplanes formicivorans TaxID=1592317 RepID=A0A194AE46_9BACT|nr:anaerobic ribonucleoside-triphosphate reductase activating protein [Desulfoplanes formicivorans]GAU08352.1 radical SAM protein [Desulfoplanes formicivorans]
MNGWDLLRGIAPVSLCDWPGHVCSVLFFGGCNLRCPTCHNRTIAWNPQRVPRLSREETMNDLAKRRSWLDGVVVTGGEACIVAGIEQVFADLRTMGLPIKLDTNGMRPDLIHEFLEQDRVDCCAVDVKGPWDKYPQLTGDRVDPGLARKHLEAIFALAIRYPERFYFRCTKVPCLTCEDIATTRSYLPDGFELILQDFIEPSGNDCSDDGPCVESGVFSQSTSLPLCDHA